MRRLSEKLAELAASLALIFISFSVYAANGKVTEAIKTVYPSKDWVISDFVVTDSRFGARPEPGFDNREAFQKAIDAAYEAGGGVVYIPAGHYEFKSTATGNQMVRVREGKSEINRKYDYQYVLRLPPGVQLRGDWADPERYGGKIMGTVLEVRTGANSSNHDGKVESWWNDPQAGNALRTSYTSVADRFIEMNACTGVTNLSIWYPEQDIDNVKPYPWTLYQTSGDSATIENLVLVNSYNGFYSAPSELHYLKNSYMTVLNKGIEIHVCTDIGRIENVKISPEYWAESGLCNSPSEDRIKAHTMRAGTGFQMHRSDWEYVSFLSVEGYGTGIWIGREPGFDDSPNAQLYGIDVDDCMNGIYVEDVNPYGILISNSSFGASVNGNAVSFSHDFDTSVQFNGVDFTGPVKCGGRGGVISFENCVFDSRSAYDIDATSGNILLTQCRFMKKDDHVRLGQYVKTVKAVNSGFGKHLDVDKGQSGAEVSIVWDKDLEFKPMPGKINTNIARFPKPSSNMVVKGNFKCATGYNNDIPTNDISAELQAKLNELHENGGGTLYLPAGRYLLEHPVRIPSGVELRGSWDVPHHTQGGGTAIFTNYDGGDEGESGPSLIQLEKNAGLRGLTVAQLNIVSDGSSIENPRRTPFLIQGQGKNVYVVDVTIAVGDKGIDLASYDTGGHYVDYLGGVLLHAGIWVGGGAQGGIIRNMQFNPHYSARLPRGGQGYPCVNSMQYIQSNCSALKFADVRNQTIFNNFVYGSVYGIHFLKDSVTGNYPGKMTMIGHGSDGCTYALFVEDADRNTEITAINSELVNTHIVAEPVRSYVLMGKESMTSAVSPEAQLILYNSAFWGSPVIGAIINNGTVRFRQANFTRTGVPGIDIRGGQVIVTTSYFAQRIGNGEVYVRTGDSCDNAILVNNFYESDKIIDK